MLHGGDEFGFTKKGNNNTYCQDNELSWFDWDKADSELIEFTRKLTTLRREHPNFRRWKWLQGKPYLGSKRPDINWFKPDGTEMKDEDWNTWFSKSLTVFLNGKAIAGTDPRGMAIVDDDYYLIFNAHYEPMEFTIPKRNGKGWGILIDTFSGRFDAREEELLFPGDKVLLQSRSMMVLRHAE